MSRTHKVCFWLAMVAIVALAAARSRVEADPAAKLLKPAYEAGFSPTDQLLKDLLEEVRGLRGDLRGALAAGQIRTDGIAVMRTRCAGCHNAGVAADKGDGIVLVGRDGSIPTFSLIEQRTIREAIKSNAMPKLGGPLTPAEKKAIEELLTLKGQPK